MTAFLNVGLLLLGIGIIVMIVSGTSIRDSILGNTTHLGDYSVPPSESVNKSFVVPDTNRIVQLSLHSWIDAVIDIKTQNTSTYLVPQNMNPIEVKIKDGNGKIIKSSQFGNQTDKLFIKFKPSKNFTLTLDNRGSRTLSVEGILAPGPLAESHIYTDGKAIAVVLGLFLIILGGGIIVLFPIVTLERSNT